MRDPTPAPPENVCLIMADGTIIAVDCAFVGWDNDIAVWEVVNAPRGMVAAIRVDALPPRTSIVFPLPDLNLEA